MKLQAPSAPDHLLIPSATRYGLEFLKDQQDASLRTSRSVSTVSNWKKKVWPGGPARDVCMIMGQRCIVHIIEPGHVNLNETYLLR